METVQAPNIEPGAKGRLVYDKARRTIVGVQANPPHPLGFHIWRNGRRWPSFAQRIREAWWCLTGEWSLHRAWQKGYDQHIMDDSMRRARGGK